MFSRHRYLMIDFETRSAVSLKDSSYDRYASHSTTDVLCLGLALDGCLARVVTPTGGPVLTACDPTPREIGYAVQHRIPVYAHNVAFDRRIYRHQAVAKLGWADIPDELWRCSMALASYYALPRSLSRLAVALGQQQQKDSAGSRVLGYVSRPKAYTKSQRSAYHELFGPDQNRWPLHWVDQKEKLEAVYAYCLQDINTQCEFLNKMGPLPQARQADWELDRRINERGVRIDVSTLFGMWALKQQSLLEYDQRVRHITTTNYYGEGYVRSINQVAAIREFLSMRGVWVPDVSKDTVTSLLAREDLPEDCRQLLLCRQQGGKSSIAKIDAFLTFIDCDGVIRDSLVWHGASTGRYTGRGVQLHNLVRDTLSLRDYVTLISCLQEGVPFAAKDWETPQPEVVPETLSKALRGLIIPRDGRQLLISDFSSIECRVLAWLSGCTLLLRAFRNKECVYRQFAERATGKPANQIGKRDKERQLGKVAVLGLGYGMGGRPRAGSATYPLSTFQAAAAGSPYFLTLTDDESIRIVDLFRQTYREIPAFWASLEDAFRQSVQHRKPVQCGLLLVTTTDDGEWTSIRLPSGRQIWYARAAVREVHKVVGKRTKKVHEISFESEHPTTRKWVRAPTWGGTLVENVVQAVACDLLVAAIRRVEEAGLPVILSVHDEVVAEGPLGEHVVEQFHQLMVSTPSWAADLPNDCETEGKPRYGK